MDYAPPGAMVIGKYMDRSVLIVHFLRFGLRMSTARCVMLACGLVAKHPSNMNIGLSDGSVQKNSTCYHTKRLQFTLS